MSILLRRVQPLKVAIIGTGLIGPRHAAAVLAEPSAELTCVVDADPALAAAAAQRFDCAWYSSVEDMLNCEEKCRPDAALVCTPNHTHVRVAKILLENGVDVLCEKPVAVDVESGKELVRIAR